MYLIKSYIQHLNTQIVLVSLTVNAEKMLNLAQIMQFIMIEPPYVCNPLTENKQLQ